MDNSIKVSDSTSRPLHPLDSVVIQVTSLRESHKVLEPLHGVSDVQLGSGGVMADITRDQPGVDVAKLGEKGQWIRDVLTRNELGEP